jgi:ATP-dependent helicase/nuclease subunit A
MDPTPQQQAVIDSTETEILVEAGAGSGKTSTSVERYIRLIDGDLEPHNILVFTFTDKAAGELREKVRAARAKRAEEAGDENPEAVSMSTSWIGTFHSICSRILRAYPVESGIDPGFTVLEATETETLKRDAFTEAARTFRNADPDAHDPFLGLYTMSRLRDTITYAYEELRSRGIDSPSLPPFSPTAYPAEDLAFLKSATEEAAGIPKLNHNYKAKILKIGELLANGTDDVEYDALAPYDFSAETEGIERFCAALTRTVHDLLAAEVGDEYRDYMRHLLEQYGASYSRLKNLRSALDYEDLQLITLRLLRDNKSIRDDYRSRFKEIMVDEFQDTNRLQLELIALLQGEGTTLITVGDEMQSIYGFRHADVELFRSRRRREDVTTYRLTDNFRSQGPVIGAINEVGVALDNQVRQRIGTGGADRHHFSELTVGLSEEGETSSTSLVLTGHNDWKGLDLGPLASEIPAEEEIGKDQDHFNEAEALQLAQHLRNLVDDERNDIQQGDIAVLLRAKTRTDVYVSALNQVGLTPYVVAGAGFWKKQEAIEVISLLSVIANPLDDNHLLGALTSPACAVSTDALWLLKRAVPDYDPMWPTIKAFVNSEEVSDEVLVLIPKADRERLRTFVTTIDLLRGRASSLPLDELLELAVTETGYDLAILYRDDTANGLANVRRVETLAREFESANGRNLRAFLDWVALSEDLDSEASVATVDENSDVVRLMTIHAAKGLEFKVVCVPDLSRQNSSRHDTLLRFGRSDPDSPEKFDVGLRVPRMEGENADLYDWKPLAETAKRETEDEELRLLHVALTRAENHLVMSGVLPAKWPGKYLKDGLLSESTPMITRISCAFVLDPQDTENWPEVVPEDGGVSIEVVKNMPGEKQSELLRRVCGRLLVPTRSATGKPPLARPKTVIHPDVPLSFSAISEYVDCPTRFYARRILRLREPDGPSGGFDPEAELISERDHGREFGNAIHDVFEHLAMTGWPEPSSSTVREALERYGLNPDEKDREVWALDMIDGFLKSDLGKRARQGKCRAEVPILLRSRSVMIRGFIDLIVDGGERPLILDYKTNSLDGSSVEQKMVGYELQRGMYSLALASSGNLDEVDTAWIFLQDASRPVTKMLGRDDLDAVRSDLAGVVAEITSTGTSPKEAAGREPCGRCWACRRLGAEAVPETLF